MFLYCSAWTNLINVNVIPIAWRTLLFAFNRDSNNLSHGSSDIYSMSGASMYYTLKNSWDAYTATSIIQNRTKSSTSWRRPTTFKRIRKQWSNWKTTPKAAPFCQILANQPSRFRLSLPNDEIVFNRTILVDLMKLSSKSVFHIVCKDILISAAIFVRGKSSIKIWNDYMRI